MFPHLREEILRNCYKLTVSLKFKNIKLLMSILKPFRSLQNTSVGTTVPAGIRLATPDLLEHSITLNFVHTEYYRF